MKIWQKFLTRGNMCVRTLSWAQPRTKANEIKVVCVTKKNTKYKNMKTLNTHSRKCGVDIKNRKAKQLRILDDRFFCFVSRAEKKLLAKEFLNNLYLRVKLVFILFPFLFFFSLAKSKTTKQKAKRMQCDHQRSFRSVLEKNCVNFKTLSTFSLP